MLRGLTKAKWWLLGLRLVLGVIFVVASVSKLAAQSQFINEVAGYGLLPHALARIYGAALPWVELFAGSALILGIFVTPTLVLCVLIALSFAIANIYALSQGMGDSCGSCFGQLIPLSLTGALVIDLLMMAAGVTLLLYRKKTASVNIADSLLTGINMAVSKISKHSARKISRAIILTVIGLAIGLPLSRGEEVSPVYAGIDSSLEQGRPVLLVFYLEGCGECEEQKPLIEEMEKTYGDSISIMYVDYEAEADVGVSFQVTRVPTMLLIGGRDENGYAVLQRFSGLVSRSSLESSLNVLNLPGTQQVAPPKADFVALRTEVEYPELTVRFVNQSTGIITKWEWDFVGDGSMLATYYVWTSPSYTYPAADRCYTVTLTVTGPGGVDTITKPAYVCVTGCPT